MVSLAGSPRSAGTSSHPHSTERPGTEKGQLASTNAGAVDVVVVLGGDVAVVVVLGTDVAVVVVLGTVVDVVEVSGLVEVVVESVHAAPTTASTASSANVAR